MRILVAEDDPKTSRFLAYGPLSVDTASRRAALAPVDRITARAAAMASGDVSARFDRPAVDAELGRMTRLLDRLLEALAANRRSASDASHELRSPLTAMQGEIDVALKRPRAPEEYRETLGVLRERAAEMRLVTDDLILLSRAQEGRLPVERAAVPLAPLLAGAAGRAAR